jgi:hypothetical protein
LLVDAEVSKLAVMVPVSVAVSKVACYCNP